MRDQNGEVNKKNVRCIKYIMRIYKIKKGC